jgi:phosphonatase-like hydrolase
MPEEPPMTPGNGDSGRGSDTPKRLSLAVFDMVGTTVQAGDEVPSSFRSAFSAIGIELSDEAIAKVRGRSKDEAISKLLATHKVEAARVPELSSAILGRFQRHLRSKYQSTAQEVPGVRTVFQLMKAAGIQLVLTTGLDHDTAALLSQALGWDGLGLEGVVSGDDVHRGRPAPDLIRAAMRLAKVSDPSSVLVVGDTAADLEAAAAARAGWNVGVLTGGHPRSRLEAHPHSVILESVRDLPGWLALTGVVPGGWA